MTTFIQKDDDGNVRTDWVPDNGYNGGYTMPYKQFEKEPDGITNRKTYNEIVSTYNAINAYKDTMMNQNE